MELVTVRARMGPAELHTKCTPSKRDEPGAPNLE